VRFARWYCDQLITDQAIAQDILWTDEASFTRTGVYSTRNVNFWSHENPHMSRESSFQNRWRFNAWAGTLSGGGHIEPHTCECSDDFNEKSVFMV
jgi:hypothetical protein